MTENPNAESIWGWSPPVAMDLKITFRTRAGDLGSVLHPGDQVTVVTEHFGDLIGSVVEIYEQGIAIRGDPQTTSFIPWWTVTRIKPVGINR